MTGQIVIFLLIILCVGLIYAWLSFSKQAKRHQDDKARYQALKKALDKDVLNMWADRASDRYFIARNYENYKAFSAISPPGAFFDPRLKAAEKNFVDHLKKLCKHVDMNSFADHRNAELRAFSAEFMFDKDEALEGEGAPERLKKIIAKTDELDNAIRNAFKTLETVGAEKFPPPPPKKKK